MLHKLMTCYKKLHREFIGNPSYVKKTFSVFPIFCAGKSRRIHLHLSTQQQVPPPHNHLTKRPVGLEAVACLHSDPLILAS